MFLQILPPDALIIWYKTKNNESSPEVKYALQCEYRFTDQ